MIDIQVTSYRQEGLQNLAQSMVDSGLSEAGAILSVSYDEQAIDIRSFYKFPFMRMIPQPKFTGIPPMYAMRREIHQLGVRLPWMLFDDDDMFVQDSVEYLEGCVNFINKFEELTNRSCYIGTAGIFGSNYHQDKIHISPQNVIMPKGNGIVFSKNIDFSGSFFSQYDPLVGGFEDDFFTALAVHYFDAVPFKRFMNPSKASFRKEKDRGKSDIHRYDIWDDNIFKAIRDLSGDQNWIYPTGMGAKGTKTPKPWIKYAEKLKEELGF